MSLIRRWEWDRKEKRVASWSSQRYTAAHERLMICLGDEFLYEELKVKLQVELKSFEKREE